MESTKVLVNFKSVLSDKKGFLGFASMDFVDFGIKIEGFGIWKKEEGIKYYSPAKMLKNGRLMDYITFSPEIADLVKQKISELVERELNPTEEDLLDFKII